MMLPNIYLFEGFGKLLFCATDLLIAYILFQLQGNELYCAIYLFNPIVFNISTRGNADQIVALLVVCCVYFLEKRRTILAAICFGISVQFKIYPIIYAPTFFFAIDRLYMKKFWPERIKFTLISFFTTLALIIACYIQYGYEFLFETYLYHLVRSDMRHNFSIYFYQMYLTEGANNLLSRLVFVPQLLIQIAVALRFHQDLTFALFIQTLVFITFNKVITVQYFVWYFALLSFVLPQSRLSMRSLMIMLVGWGSTQAIWLNYAYRLEFLGHNTFFQIWISGIAFFLANIAIIIMFIKNQTIVPFFKEKYE